jgi:cytochrome c5
MKTIFQLTLIGTALLAASSTVQARDVGVSVYNSKCIICHASGVAGAPKLGDKAAWKPRIATGMEALLNSAINGKNSMPPKGTCVDCTDADLAAAIEFMVSKSE